MRLVVRIGVALAILLPLLVAFHGAGWLVTFGIALAGFGTGRAVEYLAFGPPTPQAPPRPRPGLAVAVAAVALGVVGVALYTEYRLEQHRAAAVDELLRMRADEAASQPR